MVSQSISAQHDGGFLLLGLKRRVPLIFIIKLDLCLRFTCNSMAVCLHCLLKQNALPVRLSLVARELSESPRKEASSQEPL